MKNQKGFTLVEGLLIFIAIALVGFIGFYVYDKNKKDESVQQISTKAQEAKTQIQELPQGENKETTNSEPQDPTKDWLTYDTESFSLKYPSDWVKMRNAKNCEGADSFYRGTSSNSAGICDSDAPVQIIVNAVKGKQASYIIDPEYNRDIKASDVTIAGIKGKKYSSISKGAGIGGDEGWKTTEYVIYTNGKTYRASYRDGGGSFKNVKNDFEIMIEQTLKFI
jgi:type II secretory pathway pseudopilin PulG